MTSFIRWEWLVPRLLTVAVLLLAVQYGLCVLMRTTVVRTGQAAIGAKVDVRHARVSLVGGIVELHDVCIANPRQPLRNLLQAERCSLDVDVNDLLHKQMIIERGAITGIEFGTVRESSGALPGARPSHTSAVVQWLGDQSADLARKWLQRLEQQFTRDLVSQLESIRLTQELVRRWPEQYRALERRVQHLKDRGSELQKGLINAQENPLRHADFLKRLPAEVAALRNDLSTIVSEIEKLPDVVDADRRAIIAARKHDEQLIRDALRIEAIEATALTTYFLRDEWDGPIGELIGWLCWTRELIDAEVELPDAPRKRGEDIFFVGCRPSPGILVQMLELQGSGRFNGRTIDLDGRLFGLSTAPALHDEPIRLWLTSQNGVPLRLQATLDRTGGKMRDEILVDCQDFSLPGMELGANDGFGLAMGPSAATMNMSVLAEGEKLTGDVQIVQKQVSLKGHVGGQLQDVPLAAVLDETLGRIHSVAVRVTLEGTLEEPKCKLWSNLGTAVAESMDRALRRAAEEHAAQVLATSQQRIDEQFATLERQLAEEQAALLKSLDVPTKLLKGMASEQSIPERLPAELGRHLPSGSLFR